MLNLGQVVYDITNKRILIFCGVTMLQNQKTSECHSVSNFLTEDMKELRFGKDEKIPFKYKNYPQDPETNKIPVGSFIEAVGVNGCYFGNINIKMCLESEKAVEAIKETFKMAKAWDPPVEREAP